MNAALARRTADERREEILDAAFAAFAETGLEGTSTELIADRVGISQPYLFRLFGTKKHLFLAAVERCLQQTLDGFKDAVENGDQSLPPEERIAENYGRAIRDRSRLRMQMQSYAAAEDPDVNRIVRRGFAAFTEYIQRVTGFNDQQLAAFIAKGMLLNVMVSMDVLESSEPWAVALREGCMAKGA